MILIEKKRNKTPKEPTTKPNYLYCIVNKLSYLFGNITSNSLSRYGKNLQFQKKSNKRSAGVFEVLQCTSLDVKTFDTMEPLKILSQKENFTQNVC